MTAICLLSFVLLWVFVLCFRDRALVRIYDIFMSRFSTFSPAPHYDTNNNYRATDHLVTYQPSKSANRTNYYSYLDHFLDKTIARAQVMACIMAPISTYFGLNPPTTPSNASFSFTVFFLITWFFLAIWLIFNHVTIMWLLNN